MVIGAKGSPLQLVLSTIYHADVPNGNIRNADVETLLADPMVKRAIPIALGDSFQSYRIVGSGKAIIDLYGGKLAEGALWDKSLQAVLGAEVASTTGLKVGTRFIGTHGLSAGGVAHGDSPYDVTGVLAPTGTIADRLIFTSVDSVWEVHAHEAPKSDLGKLLSGVLAREPTAQSKKADEQKVSEAGKAAVSAKKRDHDHDHGHDHDHDHEGHSHAEPGQEVTAFLVQYASPLAVAVMPRMVNATGALQAAVPAYETARLLSMLGFALDALRIFAVVLIIAAALGLFIALTNALTDRAADLALMRLLGAFRGRLTAQLVGEGVTLTVAGALLGLVLGHGLTHLLGAWLTATRQMDLTGAMWVQDEWWLLVGALLLGALAAAIPAWRVGRQDVAPLLYRRG
ncbi:MAG: FtsX-like permease family protein [Burkholderiales bacterium]